jgi:hypothetical protein
MNQESLEKVIADYKRVGQLIREAHKEAMLLREKYTSEEAAAALNYLIGKEESGDDK